MGNICCEQGNQQHIQKLKDKFKEYKIIFNYKKTKSIDYFKDIEEKENFVSQKKLYLSKLNKELSSLNDQLNISSLKQKKEEKTNIDEKNDLLNDFEDITNKLNEFQNLLEKRKTLIKNLENNFIMIQDQIDIGEKLFNKKEIINNALIENKVNKLNEQLEENEKIFIELKENKKNSEIKNTEIKRDIESIQNINEGKLSHSQKILLNGNDNKKDLNNSSSFFNSSMLLRIKDFTDVKKKLESDYIFQEEENNDNKYENSQLIKKIGMNYVL